MPNCPFCELLSTGLAPDVQNEHVVSVPDRYPVNPGHALIVTRRHVKLLSDLTDVEHQALWALVPEVCRKIGEEYRPDGYNIGVNDGPAAGQTIPHVHLHVIPRHGGDVDDPRGGIRHVIPERASYWAIEDQ